MISKSFIWEMLMLSTTVLTDSCLTGASQIWAPFRLYVRVKLLWIRSGYCLVENIAGVVRYQNLLSLNREKRTIIWLLLQVNPSRLIRTLLLNRWMVWYHLISGCVVGYWGIVYCWMARLSNKTHYHMASRLLYNYIIFEELTIKDIIEV